MSFQRPPPDFSPPVNQSRESLRRREFPQIAGYEIDCELGRGGMATVYRATQQSLQRQVAIKILAQEVDDASEIVQRFKHEGQILARLLHPNVVNIYDVGITENNQLYLSIEYLSGGTLQERIQQGLSIDLAIYIVQCIAKALGYAHEKGVIHRDIKPSNIMFRHDDTPVLTDFGVARLAESNTIHTAVGTVVGSPSHMSPEQAKGESATTQSDLYGLGVVLYEMLTGRPPYQADNSLAIMLKHLHAPVPNLPSQCAHLQPVLNKLLAKKTADRYQNTHEFLKALNLIVPGDTGLQSGWNTSGKLQGFLKERSQRPVWIGVIGAVILAIAVGYTLKSRNTAENPPESVKPVEQMPPLSREAEIAELLKLRQEAEQRIAELRAKKVEQERQQETQLQVEQLLSQAQSSFQEGLLEISLAHIAQGLMIAPQHQNLLALLEQVKARVIEQQRQAEARQQQAEARRQVEEAERQKAEQARRRQEASQSLVQALELQRSGKYTDSLQQVEKGLALIPDHLELTQLRDQIHAQQAVEQKRQAEQARREQEIKALHQQAEVHFKAGRLIEPAGSNAEQAYRQIIQLDAGNAQAQAGLARIAQDYLQQAQQKKAAGALPDSLALIDKGLAVIPNQVELAQLRGDVSRGIEEAKARQQREKEQQVQAKQLLAQAQRSVQEGQLEAGLTHIEQGLLAVPNHRELLALREQVKTKLAEQQREAQARQKAEEAARQKAEEAERQRAEAARQQAEEAERVKVEQARQQAEAQQRQQAEARRQAEEAERQKTEQARRRQETSQSLSQALELQKNGKYTDSLQQIEKGLALIPDHPELAQLRDEVRAQQAAEQQRQTEQIKRNEEIKKLLDQAETQFKAKRLTEPVGNNAEATYRQLLKLDASNTQAQAGLARIAQDYLQQAQQKKAAGALQDSLKLIEKGLAVISNQTELMRLKEEVRAQSAVEQQKLEQQRQEKQQQEQQQEKQRQDEKQRKEQQRKEQQRLEQQRQEKQQQEQQRLEQQQEKQRQDEKQRKEQQRLEQQWLEKQQQEQQRKEQQRLEQQRQEKQQQEQQRQDTNDMPDTKEKPKRRIFGTF